MQKAEDSITWENHMLVIWAFLCESVLWEEILSI